MSDRTHCDAPRCDRSKHPSSVEMWFHLDEVGGVTPIQRHGVPPHGLDFCSLSCMDNWLTARGINPIIAPHEVSP